MQGAGPTSSSPSHTISTSLAVERLSTISDEHEIDRVRQHLAEHKASTRNLLDALADEAGAQTGQLQRQINELQKQVAELKTTNDEMRGEIALLRALQPKRSLPRKAFGGAQSNGLDETQHVN
jgi:peptidoglycan hydrolase CwlO-like protein